MVVFILLVIALRNSNKQLKIAAWVTKNLIQIIYSTGWDQTRPGHDISRYSRKWYDSTCYVDPVHNDNFCFELEWYSHSKHFKSLPIPILLAPFQKQIC